MIEEENSLDPDHLAKHHKKSEIVLAFSLTTISTKAKCISHLTFGFLERLTGVLSPFPV